MVFHEKYFTNFFIMLKQFQAKYKWTKLFLFYRYVINYQDLNTLHIYLIIFLFVVYKYQNMTFKKMCCRMMFWTWNVRLIFVTFMLPDPRPDHLIPVRLEILSILYNLKIKVSLNAELFILIYDLRVHIL